MDALSVAGRWLAVRNLLDSFCCPCIRVVPETGGRKHSLVVTVELVDLPHNDPVCITLGLRRPTHFFLAWINLDPSLPAPDSFAEPIFIVLLHSQWLELFILSFSSLLLPGPLLTHQTVLLYGPTCHLLPFSRPLLCSLLWPLIGLIFSVVESTIFQLTLTLRQISLCLFELFKSFPLEELVGRTNPLQATHLEVFEEVELPVFRRGLLIIDIWEVYRAIRWLL